MPTFALWVDRVEPGAEGGYLCGEPLSQAVCDPAFRHEGRVLFLSPRGREIRQLALHPAHVSSIPRPVCLRATPLPGVEAPFLLTDDEQMRVVFNGGVTFTLADRFQALVPRRGTLAIPLGGGRWIGVLNLTRAGFWRRTTTAHLLAFSPQPTSVPENGPVSCPSFPTVEVGTLALPRPAEGHLLRHGESVA
jgi:hypothetical protein